MENNEVENEQEHLEQRQVLLRLPAWLVKMLDHVSEQCGLTRHEFIRRAVIYQGSYELVNRNLVSIEKTVSLERGMYDFYLDHFKEGNDHADQVRK